MQFFWEDEKLRAIFFVTHAAIWAVNCGKQLCAPRRDWTKQRPRIGWVPFRWSLFVPAKSWQPCKVDKVPRHERPINAGNFTSKILTICNWKFETWTKTVHACMGQKSIAGSEVLNRRSFESRNLDFAFSKRKCTRFTDCIYIVSRGSIISVCLRPILQNLLFISEIGRIGHYLLSWKNLMSNLSPMKEDRIW